MGLLPVAVVALATCIAFSLRKTHWSEIFLRVSRWTYGIVFPLSLLYFPLKAHGWRPIQCEWTFDLRWAVASLGNIQHLVGFTIFFVLTVAQLRNVKRALAWAFLACFVFGFLVEIAEGATGIHNCRMRDLIPDMAGACVGAIIVLAARRMTRAVR